MKVAIIYNKNISKVINTFGMQNKEIYKPETVNAVAKALENGGHNVSTIDGDMHVIERLHDFMPQVLDGEKMGIVFNMAYGIQGESRYTHIPSMLEMLGIPYVGSSPAGHALALDKVVTKIILQQHNLPTPNFWVFSSTDSIMADIEYPVIVKPKMEAVSYGLKIVENYYELKEAIEFIIKEFNQPALVEQFIEGREFAVGLLGNNPLEVFPILEIDLENNPKAIQTFEDKSQNPKNKICPADLPEHKIEEISNASKEAFKALQLRDFARVDFRMDKEGNIYILELNSMASLGSSGSYPFAANVAGYNYQSLVNKMLDVAVNRYFTTSEFATEAERFYKTVPLHIRIRGYIRGRQVQTERLLKELVNTNSYIRNLEGVKSATNLIKKQLSGLGFSFESFKHIEVGNSLLFSNSNDNNFDILLLGNIDNDTKISNHVYFEEAENKLIGSGIWENKSGLVIMISALQALRFVKQIKKIKIGILLTTDDTLQGKFSKEIIKKFSNNAKYIYGLHGAFLNGGLVTSRSGSAVYNIQLSLKNTSDSNTVARVSNIFLRLLADLSKLSVSDDSIVIAPSRLEMESNITDPFIHGSASVSVRFNETDQMRELDATIRKLIRKKNGKGYNIHVEGGIRRPSMVKSQKIEKLWSRAKGLANKLDINIREEHRWSSADICFIESDKYIIDGLGAAGAKPNRTTEYILRHSLLERASLLTELIINSGSKK